MTKPEFPAGTKVRTERHGRTIDGVVVSTDDRYAVIDTGRGGGLTTALLVHLHEVEG